MRQWLRCVIRVTLAVFLLCSLIPVMGQPDARAEAVNLLNGSFEAGHSAEGYWSGLQPSYWSEWVPSGKPILSLDSGIYYEGGRSLTISSAEYARADVLQIVDVTPGEAYTLSGWLRTKDLNSRVSYGGAFIRTQYLNSSNDIISSGPSSSPLLGTHDWTEHRLELSIPQQATRLKVELFYESAVGEAWYDAIRLRNSGSNPTDPPADAAQFKAVRDKRIQQLTGNASYHSEDSDMNTVIASLVESVSNSGDTGYWNTMNKQADRSSLWSDLSSRTESSHVTGSFQRLRQMALAYATQGSSLYQDQQLRADLISGLDWMYANRYNERVSPYKNWWDWEIGTPQYLNDITVLLFEDLSAVQIDSYNRAIDAFVPDPTRRTVQPSLLETGANLVDKAFVVTLRGATGASGAKLIQGRDAISPVFPYVTRGDGFYADGSFVQHDVIAYTGSYGTVLLDRLSEMLYLLDGSPWQVIDPQAANMYRWIEDSFEPLIYKGAMMDMVRGRAISREQSTDHTAGRGTIKSILRLSEAAPAAESIRIKSAVKAWIQQDVSLENYYVGLSTYDIALMKNLLQDSSILPREDLVKHQVFAGMDRIIHLRPGFGFGISMSSKRIASYEYGNGENKKPWHTGNGMTYLYNDDLTQYSDGYWATADMLRLPGTTTDGSYSSLRDWKYYLSPKSWVGGASLDGQYGAAGMEFAAENSSLTGKKSWFSFDNEIVALGTGISGGDGRQVETIVDNRKVSEGSGELTVNGTSLPVQPGWSEKLSDVSWAHLDGNGKGDIGYYFPKAAMLQGKREARTGSWKDVNNGGSASPITREYVSLAFDHGMNPNIGSYSYVLLPNYDAQATLRYSQAPDITVLSNGTSVQSVREHKLGITAINYWSSAVVDGIASKQPASALVKETDSELVIAVSDPTQNQSQIVMELNRKGWRLASADSTITVQQTEPSIKLTVNTAGAKGRTHTVRFTK